MTPQLILFAAVGVVFVALALVFLIKADRQRRSHVARLRRLRPQAEIPMTTAARKRTKRQNQHGLFGRIERQLAQTSLRVTVVELTVQVSMGVLGLYGLLVVLAGMSLLKAVPVALVIPVALATLFVRIAKARYRFQFTETLPDSLSRLEQRLPTAEVSFFSVATSLQAETGGNLIETMEGLATQLRERRKLRKKARARTSEARASAVVLASLPFAVGLAIWVQNGEYHSPLYTDPRGQMMSLVAISSVFVATKR